MNNITLKQEFESDIEGCLLPFWSHPKDNENGGFYGLADFNGNVDKQAYNGAILNSRIFWFFSAAYELDKDENTLESARQAYRMLTEKFQQEVGSGLQG